MCAICETWKYCDVLPAMEEGLKCSGLAGVVGEVCRGRVQHASGVTHLIVEQVSDLSSDLRRVSGIGSAFPVNAGRGDDAKRGGKGEDGRDPKPIIHPRDMYEPDMRIETLKVRAWNFR